MPDEKYEAAVGEVLKLMADKKRYEQVLKGIAQDGFRKVKTCYICGKKRKVSHPWISVRNTEDGPVIEMHTIQTCRKHSDPMKLVELKRSIVSNGLKRGKGLFVTAVAEGSDKYEMRVGDVGSDA